MKLMGMRKLLTIFCAALTMVLLETTSLLGLRLGHLHWRSAFNEQTILCVVVECQ